MAETSENSFLCSEVRSQSFSKTQSFSYLLPLPISSMPPVLNSTELKRLETDIVVRASH